MIVIAKTQGFYRGERYRAGDEIEWDVRDKLGKWVKPKDPLAPEPEEPAAPPPPDWKKIGRPDDYPPSSKFAKTDTRKPTPGKVLKDSLKKVTAKKAAKQARQEK